LSNVSQKEIQHSEPVAIDETDRELLKILQNDARTTREEIARELKLSKSAVQYRIKRLESSGVIEGYYAKVNAGKLGRDFQAITLVRAKYSPAYYEKLGTKLASLPGVSSVYFTFGDNDFVLLSREVSREALIASIENMTRIGGIERTNTQLVAKVVKEDHKVEI
jgi:Lrp/AsnC family transcriptional regulator, leucine-responsive regulatory protein